MIPIQRYLAKLITAICAAPSWTRTYHTASTFNDIESVTLNRGIS